MPPHLPYARPGRWLRRSGAAIGIASLGLSSLVAPRALAQTATGSTTTTIGAPSVSPTPTTSTTTTGSAGAGGTTTTTPTVPATTTTTGPPPPAWVATVPGPPPPVPVTASPDDLAQAAQLERQLEAESKTLDVLAERYDQAQQTVERTAAGLSRAQGDLAAADARDRAAEAALIRSRQVVQNAAIEAYVGGVTHGAPSGRDALVESYQRGLTRAFGQTAFEKSGDAVRRLHATEARLREERGALAAQRRQAAVDGDAARDAAAKAQLAAQGAAAAQLQLLSTVAGLQGNVATLVAAARAADALAAYRRFTTGGQLDFLTPNPVASPPAQTMVAMQAALAQVGKPYVWGAAGPDSFDCSGLMKWSWARAGVALPRVAADQQAWATPVPISQLQPGDLVFFGQPAEHVGLYVGNGTMVNAPHSGANVEVVPIWWADLAGFGRVGQA